VDNLRLWIVLLALSAFGAGIGVGWFGSSRNQAELEHNRSSGPFEAYRREFVATFKPSPERARLLGELLAHYQREIEVQEQVQLDRGREELERELGKLALTYRERIRNSVLPPDQRGEYDRLAAGMDWKTNL
jgi:hypothetical protein